MNIRLILVGMDVDFNEYEEPVEVVVPGAGFGSAVELPGLGYLGVYVETTEDMPDVRRHPRAFLRFPRERLGGGRLAWVRISGSRAAIQHRGGLQDGRT